MPLPTTPNPADDHGIAGYVDTPTAAQYLHKKPRTLHAWAQGRRPALLIPVRVGGHLLWRVSDLRRLLEVGSA